MDDKAVKDDWTRLKAEGATFHFGDKEVLRASNRTHDEDASHIMNMLIVVRK